MDNQDIPPTQPPTPTPPAPIAQHQAAPPQNLSNNAETPRLLGRADKFKHVFFQVLIGCLIGAAAIAVIAVLVGKFNDTLARSLGTIATVALHAILSFSYITETEKRDKKDGGRSIGLFSNGVFTLIVISFITSVFRVRYALVRQSTTALAVGE